MTQGTRSAIGGWKRTRADGHKIGRCPVRRLPTQVAAVRLIEIDLGLQIDADSIESIEHYAGDHHVSLGMCSGQRYHIFLVTPKTSEPFVPKTSDPGPYPPWWRRTARLLWQSAHAKRAAERAAFDRPGYDAAFAGVHGTDQRMRFSDDPLPLAIARAHAVRRGGVWERWEQLDGTPTRNIKPTQAALRRRMGIAIPEDAEIQAEA